MAVRGRDGRVSFVLLWESTHGPLLKCYAGHCVTRWTRGSVEPQAAPGSALAPLLARARALPLSAMAIMVTLGMGAQLPPTFKKANAR